MSAVVVGTPDEPDLPEFKVKRTITYVVSASDEAMALEAVMMNEHGDVLVETDIVSRVIGPTYITPVPG